MRRFAAWEFALLLAFIGLLAWAPHKLSLRQVQQPGSSPSIDAAQMDAGLQTACFLRVIRQAEEYRANHGHPVPLAIYLNANGDDPSPHVLEAMLHARSVRPISRLTPNSEKPYWVVTLSQASFNKVDQCQVKASFDESDHRWGTGHLLELRRVDGVWEVL